MFDITKAESFYGRFVRYIVGKYEWKWLCEISGLHDYVSGWDGCQYCENGIGDRE